MCTVTEDQSKVSSAHSPQFCFVCFLFGSCVFSAPHGSRRSSSCPSQLIFGVGVCRDRRKSADRSSVKFAGRYEVSPPIVALSSPPAAAHLSLPVTHQSSSSAARRSSLPAVHLSSPPAVAVQSAGCGYPGRRSLKPASRSNVKPPDVAPSSLPAAMTSRQLAGDVWDGTGPDG